MFFCKRAADVSWLRVSTICFRHSPSHHRHSTVWPSLTCVEVNLLFDIMRHTATFVLVVATCNLAWGFTPCSPLRCAARRASAGHLKMAYVPDGLSPEEWKKIQKEEKAKAANLGRVGPVRFKSRSFKAWQESGAGHLFPVDPKKVRTDNLMVGNCVPLAENACKRYESRIPLKAIRSRVSLTTIPLWPSVANPFISCTCRDYSRSHRVQSIPLGDKAYESSPSCNPHPSQDVREQADVALLKNSRSLPSSSRDNTQMN